MEERGSGRGTPSSYRWGGRTARGAMVAVGTLPGHVSNCSNQELLAMNAAAMVAAGLPATRGVELRYKGPPANSCTQSIADTLVAPPSRKRPLSRCTPCSHAILEITYQLLSSTSLVSWMAGPSRVRSARVLVPDLRCGGRCSHSPPFCHGAPPAPPCVPCYHPLRAAVAGGPSGSPPPTVRDCWPAGARPSPPPTELLGVAAVCTPLPPSRRRRCRDCRRR